MSYIEAVFSVGGVEADHVRVVTLREHKYG
jgi:hypothetical protein